MQRIITLTIVLILVYLNGFSQSDKDKEIYKQAFNEQLNMLKGEKQINFKRAVFLTENAFYNGKLDYATFDAEIKIIGKKLIKLIEQRGLTQYKTAGNWAVFSYMIDTLPINNYKPYTYDFDDFMGDKDWTKMFVTKLLKTKGGNCHSLPYLYKILCEEIGANAYLALAPNHIYIKHIAENGQWVNLELTNGGFPRDQWIIKQMAISVEAIKNETYMKPLSQKESVALTMFDLASAYNFQYGMDKFYITVIDTALVYFPKCIPLLMCKINYYGNFVKNEKSKLYPNRTFLKKMYNKQEAAYNKIVELGYKDMPPDVYEQWVKSVEEEKNKRILNKK